MQNRQRVSHAPFRQGTGPATLAALPPVLISPPPNCSLRWPRQPGGGREPVPKNKEKRNPRSVQPCEAKAAACQTVQRLQTHQAILRHFSLATGRAEERSGKGRPSEVCFQQGGLVLGCNPEWNSALCSSQGSLAKATGGKAELLEITLRHMRSLGAEAS